MYGMLLAVGVVISAAAASQEIPPDSREAPPAGQSYRLVFRDTFDRVRLSPDGKGDYNWYNGIWFQSKTAPNSNINNAPGYLAIHWKRDQEPPETSITTLSRDLHHVAAWRYGYFEARMKWKPVRGSWPAFWLIPVEDANQSDIYGGRKESGEIDIFEGMGDQPQAYFATIHDWVNGKSAHDNGSTNRVVLPPNVNYDEWHTYGLLWVPGRVTWYFDNKPIHSEITYGVFDKQNYFIVIGQQEGVDWKYGDLTGVTENDLALNVQWVKVWQSRQ
jgi:glycosyl hydrolase family 16